MQVLAVLQVALAILPLVNTGVAEFIAWITVLKSAAEQTAEWNQAMEQQYRAALFAKTGDSAYTPDP